jgi:hypothetical protein
VPVIPATLASTAHRLTVRRRGPQMPLRAAVLGSETIRRRKAPGMTGGFAPLDATLASTRRPRRVLTPLVKRAMRAMFQPRHHLTVGGGVTLERIRDDPPGHMVQAFAQRFEKCLVCPLVATTRHPALEA